MMKQVVKVETEKEGCLGRGTYWVLTLECGHKEWRLRTTNQHSDIRPVPTKAKCHACEAKRIGSPEPGERK